MLYVVAIYKKDSRFLVLILFDIISISHRHKGLDIPCSLPKVRKRVDFFLKVRILNPSLFHDLSSGNPHEKDSTPPVL